MADLKISQFVDGGAIQSTDEIATNRAGINTKVFVGGAAALDAGSGVGDVITWQDDGSGNPTIAGMLRKDETVIATSISGAYNIDFSQGQVWDLTATGDCDIDIINPPSMGCSIPVKIVQDSTPRTIDFVISGLTWANGVVPTMPAAAGDFIWVLFVTDDGGATWTGFDCGVVEP